MTKFIDFPYSCAMKLLEARPIRKRYVDIFRKRTELLKIKPALKVILVGEHPPSLVYTRRKKDFIEKCGGDCEIISLPENIAEGDFLGTLKEVVASSGVHGCLIQLPLPRKLSHLDLGSLIPPEKDVDGFHGQNLTPLLKGQGKGLFPCTPRGILILLKEYGIELAKKRVTVIGRSFIVGRPMALLALNNDATVSICHSKTPNLAAYTRGSDIIISAVGKARYFKSDLLDPSRRDQVLVDVGIVSENGKICGDMDFENLKNICGAITPVPGGVGPMTILALTENLFDAAEKLVNL